MNLNLLILFLAVAIVIAGQIHLIAFNVTSFEEGAKSEGAAFYFDKKFVPVMDEISAKVPQNETIVMSYDWTSLLEIFIKSKIVLYLKECTYGISLLRRFVIVLNQNG